MAWIARNAGVNQLLHVFDDIPHREINSWCYDDSYSRSCRPYTVFCRARPIIKKAYRLVQKKDERDMKAKLTVTLDDGSTFVKEYSQEDSKMFVRDQRTGEVVCMLSYEIRIDEAAWMDIMLRRMKGRKL